MSFCVKNLRCLVFVPLQLQFFEWFRAIWTRRVCLLRWAGEPPTRLQGSSSPYPFVAGSWRCQVCLLCQFLLPFWFPDSCPLSLEDVPQASSYAFCSFDVSSSSYVWQFLLLCVVARLVSSSINFNYNNSRLIRLELLVSLLSRVSF